LRYNKWRTWYFDPAVEAAGLTDVTPHDLRATHASWVADRQGVMAAAHRMGHSNASVTTRHYARMIDGRDAEVADSLDADHRPLPPGSGTADGAWLDPASPATPEVAQEWHDDDGGGAAAVA
jgi:hypothetical protein